MFEHCRRLHSAGRLLVALAILLGAPAVARAQVVVHTVSVTTDSAADGLVATASTAPPRSRLEKSSRSRRSTGAVR